MLFRLLIRGTFVSCGTKHAPEEDYMTNTMIEDFGFPQGALKGIIAAAYSLGAILSLPFIPIVNDTFGRRWSIFGGSCIMVTGAIIQGFSQNGQFLPRPAGEKGDFTKYIVN
jgi:MFS family permease